MDRNYDEIISEMLRQLDRHSEHLALQTAEMLKQSKRSDALWMEQRKVNAELFDKLNGLQAVTNQNLERSLHTAEILGRIIKRNRLRL